MISFERTLKMTVEHLSQLFPINRNLRDIEVDLICSNYRLNFDLGKKNEIHHHS